MTSHVSISRWTTIEVVATSAESTSSTASTFLVSGVGMRTVLDEVVRATTVVALGVRVGARRTTPSVVAETSSETTTAEGSRLVATSVTTIRTRRSSSVSVILWRGIIAGLSGSHVATASNGIVVIGPAILSFDVIISRVVSLRLVEALLDVSTVTLIHVPTFE